MSYEMQRRATLENFRTVWDRSQGFSPSNSYENIKEAILVLAQAVLVLAAAVKEKK